jgi:hypothetical protein
LSSPSPSQAIPRNPTRDLWNLCLSHCASGQKPEGGITGLNKLWSCCQIRKLMITLKNSSGNPSKIIKYLKIIAERSSWPDLLVVHSFCCLNFVVLRRFPPTRTSLFTSVTILCNAELHCFVSALFGRSILGFGCVYFALFAFWTFHFSHLPVLRCHNSSFFDIFVFDWPVPQRFFYIVDVNCRSFSTSALQHFRFFD